MDTKEAVKCIICGFAVEEWLFGGGYGHNPDPWPSYDDEDRCCNWCNAHVVIPVRLRRAGALKG